MNVRQLSVYVKNEAGIVSEVTDVLGRADINILGFSVADTIDGGVIRLVVNKPETAAEALAAAGYTTSVDEVLCVALQDQPGGLASVLKAISAAGINVENVYALIATYAVINVADAERATNLLKGGPVVLATQEEISLL